MWDLVSYNEKHNMANGEENRDGCNNNLSWNCGVEGETDDKKIHSLRIKQVKNFMAILLLSQGLPMILSGDEVLRSQHGNNNCYCQDNELSWFNWDLVKRNKEMFRFVKEMIAFRKRHPSLIRRRFVSGIKQKGARLPDITWHGKKINKPPWHNSEDNVLAFTLGAIGIEEDLHIILNMSPKKIRAELPRVQARKWYKAVDTAAKSPSDIKISSKQRVSCKKTCTVHARSIVVLESRA